MPALERAWLDGALTWDSCGALLPLEAGKAVARVSDNFIRRASLPPARLAAADHPLMHSMASRGVCWTGNSSHSHVCQAENLHSGGCSAGKRVAAHV